MRLIIDRRRGDSVLSKVWAIAHLLYLCHLDVLKPHVHFSIWTQSLQWAPNLTTWWPDITCFITSAAVCCLWEGFTHKHIPSLWVGRYFLKKACIFTKPHRSTLSSLLLHVRGYIYWSRSSVYPQHHWVCWFLGIKRSNSLYYTWEFATTPTIVLIPPSPQQHLELSLNRLGYHTQI